MYEIDLLRGIVYKGLQGFRINYENNNMYIIDNGMKIFLNEDNSIMLNLNDNNGITNE